MSWQLQTAKQRFSEVVNRALSEGPQEITRHGEAVVVILAVDDYDRLRGRGRDFKQFLMDAPDFGELCLERPHEPARTVDLDLPA